MQADIGQLWDREMIRDCLYRYCRGIDRVDEALLRSAYWPDGTDTHGAYRGSASGFVDWAMEALPKIERGIHQFNRIDICNVGGLTEAMKVAGWSEAHYVDMMPHNPLGPICTAATPPLRRRRPRCGVARRVRP